MSSTSALSLPVADHEPRYSSTLQHSSLPNTSFPILTTASDRPIWPQQLMDPDSRNSAHSSSDSQPRRSLPRNSPPFNTSKSSTTSNNISPTSHNQPLPPLAINSFKDISRVKPQFTVPPLPAALSSRRRSHSPDYRVSPNPARQVFSYPVSYPQDAPAEYNMSHDDGPQPLQKRKRSPDTQGRPLRSDEESDSRRGSASKGAMSYDPVHEYHQQAHQHHHSRRPSSAASQHSHVSSYSNQSSTNMEGDEPISPMAGDQSISRDGKKRKHQCEECGQYFTRLHNLKSHLLTHSQEKPFICTECGHKFRRLHDLKRISLLDCGSWKDTINYTQESGRILVQAAVAVSLEWTL